MNPFRGNGALRTGWTQLLLFLLAFLWQTPQADATHFAYGTIYWARDTTFVSSTLYRIKLSWELGYRWSFSSWAYKPVGTTIYLSMAYSSPTLGQVNGQIPLVINSINSGEDYFVGTASQTIDIPISAFSQGGVTVWHTDCCRLSTLLENNKDSNWRVQTVISIANGNRSPRSTALPRIYVQQNVPVAFTLPSVAFDGLTNIYEMATTSESTLPNPRPCGASFCSSGCSGCGSSLAGQCSVCVAVSSQGTVTWTPQIKGLYAVQFKIVSVDSSGNRKNIAPVDLIFSVVAACTTGMTGCFQPPVFDPVTPPTYIAYVGLELRFNVKSISKNSGYYVTTSTGAIPSGVTVSGCAENPSSPACTQVVRWTPTLGQGNQALCFQAADYRVSDNSAGAISVGQYCVQMVIGTARIIYLSGIVRDFRRSFPDFNRATGDYSPARAFVRSSLDGAGKPVFAASANPTTVKNESTFNAWFRDIPLYNSRTVYSITLSNALQADSNLYSFYSSQFWPIDNQLFGNEGDANNRYFTYEVNTYTTYNPGQVFNFRSSDDMWFFINGNLIPGWNLQGVHSEQGFTVNMDSLGLVSGETYRADIFFAHRGATSTPSVQIQMPEAALCNALSTGIKVVDIPTNGFTSSNMATLGRARFSGGVLQPINVNEVGPTGGAAWYAVGGVAQQVIISNGFSTTFVVSANPLSGNVCHGFAFVLQAASAGARGGDAGNLGYAGIERSIAIEFDGNQDASLSDPAYGHVAAQSRYNLQNSAVQQSSVSGGPTLGISANDPALPITICNGSDHTIRIEYLPGQVDPGAAAGTPAIGWIRVFMNANLVPSMQAQIDSNQMDNLIGTAAFVGFTSAISDTLTHTVNVRSWSMTVVQTSPPLCAATVQPQTVVAGTRATAVVQARDACNNNIRVGGENSKIVSTLSTLRGNAVSVPTTQVDNGDGTYSIIYTPTIATLYSLSVVWSGSKVMPAASNPFEFTVLPGAADPTRSTLIYSLTPLFGRLNNAPTPTTNAVQGLHVVIVDSTTLSVSLRRTFDLTSSTERTAFQAAIAGMPANHVVGMSVWGGAALNLGSCTCGAGSSDTATLGLVGITLTESQYYPNGCCTQARQWSAVGVRSGTATQSIDSVRAYVARCFTTGTNRFIHFCMNVTSTSASSIEQISSNILVLPTVLAAPTGSSVSMAVTARDTYGNLLSDVSTTFAISFSPSISNVQPLCNGAGCSQYDPATCSPGFTTFTFNSLSAGSFSMYVYMLPGNVPIAGSPFTVVMRPGPASGLTSQAQGTGLTTATAGAGATFQLNLADVAGNAVLQPQGDNITAVIVNWDGTSSGAITPDPNWTNGPLTMSYNVTVATPSNKFYRIVVWINGVMMTSLANSQVSVAPAAVNARTSTANAIGVTPLIVVGTTASFTIQARDAFMNNRLTANDAGAFVYSISPSTDITNQDIQYVGLGQYQATFRATQATVRTITVTLNGINIQGSPFSVPFQAGPVGSGSFIASTMPSSVIAGSNNSFTVQSRDSFGNDRPVGVDAAAFVPRIRTASGLSATTTSFSAIGGTRYNSSWTSTLAGNYSVGALISSTGSDVTGSPAFVQVVASTTVASMSVASGTGLSGGIESSTVTFSIQARDKYGNNQQTGVSDNFRYSLVRLVDGSTVAGPACTSQPNGVYSCSYTVPARSSFGVTQNFTYIIRVELNVAGSWTAIANSPFRAFCAASGSASGAIIKQTDLPLRSIPAGTQGSFTIEDRNSNNATEATGGSFAVQIISLDNTRSITAAVTATSDPIYYSVSFTPQGFGIPGVYSVTLFWNGIKTYNSPYSLTVNPGPYVAALTELKEFERTVTAGVSSTFKIQLKDQFSNIVNQPLSAFNASFGSPEDMTVAGVWDAQNKVYSFTYTRTKAGAVTVFVYEVSGAIKLGSAIISDTVTVKPGPANVRTQATLVDTVLIAGTPASFLAYPVDFWGNAITEPNSYFINITARLSNDASVPFGCSHNGGIGRPQEWVCRYTPLVYGVSVSLAVFLNGAAISNSPFALTVQAGAVSQANSFVTIPSTPFAAGRLIWFVLTTRDAFNNPGRDDISAITVTPKNPSGSTLPSATVNAISGAPTGDYNITLFGISSAGLPLTAQAGSYNFSIAVAGLFDTMSLTGNRPISVVAGAAYAPQSNPFGIPESTTVPVDSWFTFRFKTSDVYQNELGTNSDLVQAFVHQGVPTCPQAAAAGEEGGATLQVNGALVSSPVATTRVTADADGKYTIDARVQLKGSYYVNVTVNGQPIPCSNRISFNTAPGVAAANNSLLIAPTSSTLTAGSFFTFDVIVRDLRGNVRSADFSDVISVGTFTDDSQLTANGYSTVRSSWLRVGDGVPAINVTSAGDRYLVTVNATLARQYVVVVSINGGLVVSTFRSVTVLPASAFSYRQPSYLNATAAYPFAFNLTAVDLWNNPITVDSFTYSANWKLVGPDYTVVGTDSPIAGLAIHTLSFMSAWHGEFETNIALKPRSGSFVPSAPVFRTYVDHATCAWSRPGTPFRCPFDRQCVSSYVDCSDISASAKSACGWQCSNDGSCFDPSVPSHSVAQCTCPNNGVRCASGHCAATANDCLSAADCPLSAPVRCTMMVNGTARSTGQCRASVADCPSPRVCPPGLVICPDSITCAASSRDCPAPPTCPSGFKTCPDRSCVRAIEDCPTPTTCPAGEVVCPDGSCQSSYLSCPDMYSCFDPAPYRCPDGTCRPDVSSCPSNVVCPIGSVKCENGQCAGSLSACTPAIKCPRNQVRCPDGSCRHNLFFCPSRITCPASTPVLCPDRSCAISSFLCPALVTCPATTVTCPDGSCVASLNLCPTSKTCPTIAPVLCPDGACKPSADLCNATTACPTSATVRCPDGSCRGSLIDCPSRPICPASTPVMCMDGTCVIALGSCPDPTRYFCPADRVQCPGGECAPSRDLCSTPITCAVGFLRCLDGTCRLSCGDIKQPACQDPSLVRCPQSLTGAVCAANITNCPQTILCPSNRPVKCLDAGCAATIGDCPPPPTVYVDSSAYSPCADGTWASGASLAQCALPPTCPSYAPYKCYDLTCRAAPRDCPVPPSCPLATPYLCPNGNCVDRLWSCKPYGSCTAPSNSTSIVQCADPDHTCKTDISLCPSIFPTSTSPTAQFCPYLWTRCKDGSCKEQASQCSDLTCPSYLPYMCTNGQCVLNSTLCMLPNGCPPSAPVKCWTGRCAATNAECLNLYGTAPSDVCSSGTVQCPDGSCNSFAACPKADGCNEGEIRCLDGTCVQYSAGSPTNPCISGSEPINTCPGARPFRCPDGFCTTSSTLCPQQPVSPSVVCPLSRPALCADGTCVMALEQCRTLTPCPPDSPFRCKDGNCRPVGSGENNEFCPCANCEYSNTCPKIPGSGIQLVRCQTGLCAFSADQCPDEATGCPGGMTRCPGSGACVSLSGGLTCSNFTEPSTGCPRATPIKCNNGQCVATSDQCPLPNGCTISQPYLCYKDGSCQASPTACDSVQTCAQAGKVQCADGKCADSAALCMGANGCPVATPIRCANGQCASFPAGTGLPNSCPLVVACDNPSQTRCYTGQCVSDPLLCPTVNACPVGQVLCADLSCATSTDLCPGSNLCPASAPVACENGFCKTSKSQCEKVAGTNNNGQGSGATVSGSSGLGATSCASPNVQCWDGSCRTSTLECLRWSTQARTTSGTAPDPAQSLISTGCPTGSVLCSDGSCMPSQYDCPIISACDRTSTPLRCPDGRCTNTTCSADSGNCAAPNIRCEDGSCRLKGSCLPFDGCPLNKPFQCLHRVCVVTPDQCPLAVRPQSFVATTQSVVVPSSLLMQMHSRLSPSSSAWRHVALQAVTPLSNISVLPGVPTDPSVLSPKFVSVGDSYNGQVFWPCNTSCYSDVKALPQQTTVDVSSNVRVDVAFQNGASVAHLLVPAGAVVSTNGTYFSPLANIRIRPVSQSRLASFINNNVEGRGLDFQYTVLSPAFECLVDSTVRQPFVLNLTYVANIDGAPQTWGQTPTTQQKDELSQFLQNVCLATPKYLPLLNSYIWTCLYFDRDTRVKYPVRSSTSTDPPQIVSSTFSNCKANANGEGPIYAFIFSPPYIAKERNKSLDWVKDNIQWILLVLAGAVLFIGAIAYAGLRFARYRKKLHAIREKRKNLEEDVAEKEQFGGNAGRKDSEVGMVANPLSQNLADLQALQQRMDAKQLELQAEEAKQREIESAQRAEVIKKMRDDREDMSKELDRLKRQLEVEEQKALEKKQEQLEQQQKAELAVIDAATVSSVRGGGAAQPAARAEFQVAPNRNHRRKMSRAM